MFFANFPSKEKSDDFVVDLLVLLFMVPTLSGKSGKNILEITHFSIGSEVTYTL